jgi:hypothetical protein
MKFLVILVNCILRNYFRKAEGFFFFLEKIYRKLRKIGADSYD